MIVIIMCHACNMVVMRGGGGIEDVINSYI